MPGTFRLRLLAGLTAATALSGCIAVDYAVDPVGCGTGSHEPIFPWYPHYLWAPPKPRVPTMAPLAGTASPAAYAPAPAGWSQAPVYYAPVNDAPVPMVVSPAPVATPAPATQ